MGYLAYIKLIWQKQKTLREVASYINGNGVNGLFASLPSKSLRMFKESEEILFEDPKEAFWDWIYVDR